MALVTFVHRAGTMVLPFLVLYLTEVHGMTPFHAGVTLAIYGVGSIVGAALSGAVTDRLSPYPVQLASLLLSGLALLVLGAAATPASIALAAAATGLVAESFRPANSVAFATRTPPEDTVRGFALRRLAQNLGMAVGPAAGGLLAVHSYRWLFVVDAATCWAAAAVLVVSLRPSSGSASPSATSSSSDRAPWRDPPYLVLVLLAGLLGGAFFQLLSTYPLTLRDLHGFGEPAIGGVFAINTLLIGLFEMVLVDRVRARHPLDVAAVGSLLVCTGLALPRFLPAALLVAPTVVVWTVGEMLALPFLETAAAQRGGSGSRGRYLALFTIAFSVAFAVAPIVGTWTYQHLGSGTLWTGCVLLGVLLALGFRLLRARWGS